jgi:hypothetical protein
VSVEGITRGETGLRIRPPTFQRSPTIAGLLTAEGVWRETGVMLLVCGATGELGGRVARRVAGHGGGLRLLLRNDAPASLAGELGADLVRGDLRDPASLERAMRGVTTVVTTVTAMGRALAGERLDVRAVDGLGSLALVAAAERMVCGGSCLSPMPG